MRLLSKSQHPISAVSLWRNDSIGVFLPSLGPILSAHCRRFCLLCMPDPSLQPEEAPCKSGTVPTSGQDVVYGVFLLVSCLGSPLICVFPRLRLFLDIPIIFHLSLRLFWFYFFFPSLFRFLFFPFLRNVGRALAYITLASIGRTCFRASPVRGE